MDYIDLGFWGRRAYGIDYIGKALKSCRRRGSAKQKDYPRNPLVAQSIGFCVQMHLPRPPKLHLLSTA